MVIFNEFEKAGLRYGFLTKHIIKKYFQKNQRYRDFFLYLTKLDRKRYVVGFSFKVSSGVFYPVTERLTVCYQTKENSFIAGDLILIGSVSFNDTFAEEKSAEEAINFFIRSMVEAHGKLASEARKEADSIKKELSEITHKAIFHGSAVSEWALLT